MNGELLRERVHALATRFSGLGIGADISAMTLIELECLYRFLRRIAGE